MITEFKDLYLPIGMAIFLGYIAYQQMIINKNKLKLDLYNKRFEVYSTTLEFYQELSGSGASIALKRKFIEKKEAAKFLFSEDSSIYSLLDEMHKNSFKVSAVKDNKGDLKGSPDLAIDISQKSQDALTWFNSEVKTLSSKMEPFLKF